MQLVKLEIKGFKSFGDKVTINFDQGITGIIGPNGCGKSNVVDSIRWVLGEQKTKALRSDKMENIIFNGTKKRKPLQMAEVSLTFNNTKNILPTEYSQITITRKYYRSGESEYLLNSVPCRLKDITNLFMDTGIASNSYAIIELKMVDDLLNDKDNSRRALFEEAAGISKFKKRKKETLKKLQDTDDDLDRVEDLLFEIEKNMKSLEKQAKQTEKYYQLKEEYKRDSIALARTTVSQKRNQFLSLTKQLEEQSTKKVSLNKLIAEKEAALEKLKADMIRKEKMLSSRQKSLNEHVNKIRSYESEKKIKNERLRFLNDKSDSLKEQIEQDKQSNERASFSIQSLELELESAEKVRMELEMKLEKLKEAHENQITKTNQLKEEADLQAKQYKNKQEAVYAIEKSLEIKEMQLNALKQELEKTASDSTVQNASLIEFEQKMTDLDKTIQEKTQALEKLKRQENELNNKKDTTGKTIELIKEEIVQVNRKLDAKQNEFNLTKSLVDNLEGFPEAIKFLKKKAKWKKEAPLLSDIITCAPEYRVTIENYLEPFLNYYIVEDYADAYKAVNLLSDAAMGKANFFILDKFDNFHPTPSKLFQNAIPATEIIEYDNKYKKIMGHILDGVYIVDGDIKDLPQDDGCIFITKSGKITKRNLSITGGSVGLFEGKKIGRAKNLEKLEEDIKKLKKKQHEVEGVLKENNKALEHLKTQSNKEAIDNMAEEIHEIKEEFVSVKTKEEQFRNMISTADMKREDILEKIVQLEEETTTLRPQSQEEKEALQEQEYKVENLSANLEEESESLNNASAAYNQENIFYHQQENRISNIEKELEFKQEAHANSKKRIERNQEQLKENDAEIKVLVQKTDDSDEDLIAMYDEKDSIERGVNEAEKDYYDCRGSIDTLEKEEREIQRNREALDQLIMELQNNVNETKLALSSVKERLSVEFEVDLDQLMMGEDAEDEQNIDEEALRTSVEKIKKRLDGLGPINPMAMEAYNEIKERFDFITEQKKDLNEAKSSLISTIEEIDSVAKVTFLEAFEKIRDNFQKVFRSLFTDEDQCELKLTNPEAPLESSIEIMAKPKGKRPLTINQLSGGEKTLTATSLLFAIYLIKPAPFCIFDEVDAPLDDANIDKFNNIIREFSSESQFIIVTHNKRTMASTDIIYGVTMLEQGVSKVMPADLRSLA